MKRISLQTVSSEIVFCNIYGLSQVWDNPTTWNFINNPRVDHGFMYVYCDAVSIVYRSGEEAVFPHGSLLYIPKYCEYYIEFCGGGSKCADILVNFDIRDLAGKEYCFADKIVCLTDDPPQKVLAAMHKIEDVSTNFLYPALQTTALFYNLLSKLENRMCLAETPDGEKSSVFPAVNYMDNHISENIAVPDLAKMCLLSESAFRKAFKAYTGMSPTEYRTHARISKAQVMLKSIHELSIEEIANRLGFYDNSYFYKVFARTVGKTPRAFREETEKTV